MVTRIAAWVPHRHQRALHVAPAPRLAAARRQPVLMAKKSSGGGEGGGSKDGGGGGNEAPKQGVKKGAGVQVITVDKVAVEVETDTKIELTDEGWWRVLLHNDEIHTFEYVVEAIVKVVPQITRKKAFVIARVVHQTGAGTVTTVWKQMAEQLCMGMQTFGLTVSIAPDAKFNDNNVRPDAPEE
jgi:ATP-dependent Clp protease adapter protein ClpS